MPNIFGICLVVVDMQALLYLLELQQTIQQDSFSKDLVENRNLVSLYDFENGQGIFPAVERNVRFCLLSISKKRREKFLISAQLQTTEGIRSKDKSYYLRAEDIEAVNPNTQNCPMFGSTQDSKIVVKIHNRLPVMVNKPKSNNPWGIQFRQGLFNMTSDSDLFRTYEDLINANYKLLGNKFVREESNDFLPLYESKLIHQYNHRAATFLGTSASERFKIHAGTKEPSLIELQNPIFQIIPRYWINESNVENIIGKNRKWFLGFRNAISATADSRSLVASIVPWSGVGNSMPVLFVDGSSINSILVLGILNSIVMDYVLKQKASGGNLNFYIVEQLPVLPINAINNIDTIYIMRRLFELVFTAWDVNELADDIWNDSPHELREAFVDQWEENAIVTGGGNRGALCPPWCNSSTDGFSYPPFKWDDDRRATLRAELDAYYAKLYGLTRDELRYILDPQDVYGPDYPNETFRVLKDKEIRQFGEYRTRRLILEAWDRLEGMEIGSPNNYQESAAMPELKQDKISLHPQRQSTKTDVQPSESLIKESDFPDNQPTINDLGLFRCLSCGKLVMSFDKGNHEREKHNGRCVEWEKVR